MNQASQDMVKAMQWPVIEPLNAPGLSRPVALNRPVCVAGLRPDINLTLASREVSRTHAIFVTDGSAVYIRDLVSRNRVYLNDVPIREATLEDGDVVRLGPVSFRCQSGFNRSTAQDMPLEPLDLYQVDTGRPIAIEGHTAVLGSRDGCDVQMEQKDAEQVHAVIFGRGGRWFVRDLQSRTHTFVNELPVTEVELNTGDAIRIGRTELRCGPLPAPAPQVNAQDTLNSAVAPDVVPVVDAIVSENELCEAEDFASPSPLDDLTVVSSLKELVEADEPTDAELHSDRLGARALELSEDLKGDDKVTAQLAVDELEAQELPIDEPEPDPATAAVEDKSEEDPFSRADAAKTIAVSADSEAAEPEPCPTQHDQDEAELAFSALLNKVVGDVKRVESAWQELIAMRQARAARLPPKVSALVDLLPSDG